MAVGTKDDTAKPDYSLLPISWGYIAAGGSKAPAIQSWLGTVVYLATEPRAPRMKVYAALDDTVAQVLRNVMPTEVEDQLVRVLEFGVAKYARDNWKVVDNAVVRYCAATRRHFSAWAQHEFGDAVAEDSGLPHWAHLLANLTFLAWFKGQA